MKIFHAHLYVRVSTDEQADKGYSQRNQEEMLKKYCEINSIYVRKGVLKITLPKLLIDLHGFHCLLNSENKEVNLILYYSLNGTGLVVTQVMLIK